MEIDQVHIELETDGRGIKLRDYCSAFQHRRLDDLGIELDGVHNAVQADGVAGDAHRVRRCGYVLVIEQLDRAGNQIEGVESRVRQAALRQIDLEQVSQMHGAGQAADRGTKVIESLHQRRVAVRLGRLRRRIEDLGEGDVGAQRWAGAGHTDFSLERVEEAAQVALSLAN